MLNEHVHMNAAEDVDDNSFFCHRAPLEAIEHITMARHDEI